MRKDYLHKNKQSRLRAIAYSATILIAIFDQACKQWALDFLAIQKVYVVFPGFQLQLAYNKGVAFSLGHGGSAIIFMLILLINFILMAILARELYCAEKLKLETIAVISILGGALGNLWDRITLGYVIDFIDWYWQDWHWPTFNIADSFITIGVILYGYSLLSKANVQKVTMGS